MSDINYNFPEKLNFLFQPKRYKVARGGRGGAKSWNFARALLITILKEKKLVLCTREIQQSLKESVFKLLTDQIQMMGLQKSFSNTQQEICCNNGSRIIFSGLRYNATTIKSMEGVDICWVEEAENISKDSWDLLIPTIRKPNSEIWISYNPKSNSDETHRRFGGRNDEDCVCVTINWRDNPWFPEELRKEMDNSRRLNFQDYLHIWEGMTKEETGETTFNPSWDEFWSKTEPRGNYYILVDPANSKTKKSDYTVFTVVCAGQDQNYYVMEWVRDRLNLQEKVDVLFRIHQKYAKKGRVTVAYEKYGMQADIEAIRMVQDQKGYRFQIQEVAGRLSKIDRIKRLVPLFSQHRVYLPTEALYRQLDGKDVDLLREFQDEKGAFPFNVNHSSLHDDMMDCMSRIVDQEVGVSFPKTLVYDNSISMLKKKNDYDPATYGF